MASIRACRQPRGAEATTPISSPPAKTAAPDMPAQGEAAPVRGSGGAWALSRTYRPPSIPEPGLNVPTNCSLSGRFSASRCAYGKPMAWQPGTGVSDVATPQRIRSKGPGARSVSASRSAASHSPSPRDHSSRQPLRPAGPAARMPVTPRMTCAAVRINRGDSR